MINWRTNVRTIRNLTLTSPEGDTFLNVERVMHKEEVGIKASLTKDGKTQIAIIEICKDGKFRLIPIDKGVEVEGAPIVVGFGETVTIDNYEYKVSRGTNMFCKIRSRIVTDFTLHDISIDLYADLIKKYETGEDDYWKQSQVILTGLVLLIANHVVKDEISCRVVNDVWNGTKGLGYIKE